MFSQHETRKSSIFAASMNISPQILNVRLPTKLLESLLILPIKWNALKHKVSRGGGDTANTSSQLSEIRTSTASTHNLNAHLSRYTCTYKIRVLGRVYSPVQPTRSYPRGDSPVARGERSCSSISASGASRRCPFSPNRRWLQNCRLKQRSALFSSFF